MRTPTGTCAGTGNAQSWSLHGSLPGRHTAGRLLALCAGRVYGKIRWRINKPDNDFIEREAMQRFEQVCRRGFRVVCGGWVLVVSGWVG